MTDTAQASERIAQLIDAGDDVIRASNTLMMLLTGKMFMSEAGLDVAVQRALIARDAWDAAIRAGEGK